MNFLSKIFRQKRINRVEKMKRYLTDLQNHCQYLKALGVEPITEDFSGILDSLSRIEEALEKEFYFEKCISWEDY